jgi:hypothetical protein
MVTTGTAALIVLLSRAPWPRPSEHALLRLSWSGRPERIERCRELSDEELEKLPAHMRQREECEGHPARYLVRVWHGGALLSRDTVTGGGLRGDRAIHMLREYRLAPGAQPVAIEVTRTDSVTPSEGVEPEEEAELEDTATAPLDRARRERQERRRERLERLPPLLRLDTTLRLAPGEVVVVTYDPIGRRLLALTE